MVPFLAHPVGLMRFKECYRGLATTLLIKNGVDLPDFDVYFSLYLYHHRSYDVSPIIT